MPGSEEELKAQIEALRGKLAEMIGEGYCKNTIQAAGALSSSLDRLIVRWTKIHAQKKIAESSTT